MPARSLCSQPDHSGMDKDGGSLRPPSHLPYALSLQGVSSGQLPSNFQEDFSQRIVSIILEKIHCFSYYASSEDGLCSQKQQHLFFTNIFVSSKKRVFSFVSTAFGGMWEFSRNWGLGKRKGWFHSYWELTIFSKLRLVTGTLQQPYTPTTISASFICYSERGHPKNKYKSIKTSQMLGGDLRKMGKPTKEQAWLYHNIEL